MEGRDHRIHAGFGLHLAGVRAFPFKSLSICVIGFICGFNSLFRVEGGVPGFQPHFLFAVHSFDIGLPLNSVSVFPFRMPSLSWPDMR